MLARRTRLVLGMALALAWLATEPSAADAPSFGSQNQIDPDWGGTASIATHPSGAVLLAARNFSTMPVPTQYSFRNPGAAAFASPNNLSGAGKNAGDPQVALDPAGNGLAIWNDLTDKEIEFGLDTAPLNSGGFSAGTPISATGKNVNRPRLAVDPSGNALAIWSENTDSDIEFSFRPVGGSFQAMHTEIANVGTSPSSPDVAFDPAGNAVAAWTEQVGMPLRHRVRVASRPANGAFSAPVFVSPAGDATAEPKLAIDPLGNVVIAYKNVTDDSTEVVTRPVGAADFGPPTLVSTPGEGTADSDYFDVAAGPGGRAAVSFPNEIDNTNEVAVRDAADQPFSAPIPVGNNPSADDTRLAYDALGNLVAAWNKDNFPEEDVEAASRPVCTGRFSRAVDASGNIGGDALVIAMDHEGDPIITDQSYVMEGDSGAPPILSALSIPSDGTTGSPLDFSVSPLDTQPVSDVTWRFGDGANASGNNASHAYAGPGTYEVAVSATDTRDNTCTERRTVTISAPPVVIPPPDLEPDSAITGLPSSQTASKLTRFRGTATDPENLLARVEIAVLQVSGGAKATARKKPKPRCRELRSDGRVRSVKLTNKRCSPKTFLAATGTTAWTFTLKRALPPGSYVLYSRAVDQAGNRETAFTSRDGNRKAFKLR